MLSKFGFVLLFFLLIFSFRIPIFYNSTILSIFISSVLMALNEKSIIVSVFKNRTTVVFLSSYFLLIIISFLFAIFHFTFEISIIRGYVSQSINIIASCFFISLVFNDRDFSVHRLLNIIITSFAIQSLIQIFALLSPEWLNLIRFFQVLETAELLDKGYGGIRGLALSSELTFGLSTAYGFVFIIHAYLISLKGKVHASDYAFLIINFVGMSFTGRTAYVGFILAIFFIMCFISLRSKIEFIFVFITSCFLSFLLANIFIDPVYFERIINYTFELFINMISNSNVETTSTNHLLDMYNLDIKDITWLFGDGLYIGKDGTYYKHIDIGYFRQVLFGGIGYVFILIVFQCTCIFTSSRKVIWIMFNRFKVDRPDFVHICFCFVTLMYLIVLNL